METLDDQLRRVLSTQVDGVEPHLHGAQLRALAASRRSRSARISGQLAAAAAVLVIALLPFALRDHSPTVNRPAGPGTGSTAPTPGAPTTPVAPPKDTLAPRPPSLQPSSTTTLPGQPVPSGASDTMTSAPQVTFPTGTDSGSTTP